MKKAVIVVGEHYAGKSRTINKYLKPKLHIGKYEHQFRLGRRAGFVLSQSREEAKNARGFILSQSFEERGKCRHLRKIVAKYSEYELLVMAARPSKEPGSCLDSLRIELRKSGYRVILVNVEKSQKKSYYRDKASEILRYLLS